MKTSYGSHIREKLAEAENERMHRMLFIEIAKTNVFERALVMFAQMIFGAFYFFMYVFFTKTLGFAISIKNIRCILSFSASASISLICEP